MLFFFIAVYPTEIVSTVGFVALGIIITFIWAYLSKRVYKTVLSINSLAKKCLLFLLYAPIDTFVYFSINIITYYYLVIMVYITFLNTLQTSPDSMSLIFQIIFSFLPPILAAAFTHALNMWMKRSRNPRDDYERIEDTAPV